MLPRAAVRVETNLVLLKALVHSTVTEQDHLHLPTPITILGCHIRRSPLFAGRVSMRYDRAEGLGKERR
jgi:hypothetical protein